MTVCYNVRECLEVLYEYQRDNDTKKEQEESEKNEIENIPSSPTRGDIRIRDKCIYVYGE